MFSKYYENELSVILIPYKQKGPRLIGWQQYCETRPSQKQIDAWDRLWDTGINIGVCLGPASNIVALDIDTNDQAVINNLPLSPVIKKGKPPYETRFFKYNKNIQSQKIVVKGGHLDILSTGRQTVLPPSIHPDTGKPYFWATPDTLLNFSASGLPELDLTLLSEFKCSAPAALINGGRNDALKKIITAQLMRGESHLEIVDYIYRHDLTYHRPPLFSDEYKGDPRYAALTMVANVLQSLIRQRMRLPTQAMSLGFLDKKKQHGKSF